MLQPDIVITHADVLSLPVHLDRVDYLPGEDTEWVLVPLPENLANTSDKGDVGRPTWVHVPAGLPKEERDTMEKVYRLCGEACLLLDQQVPLAERAAAWKLVRAGFAFMGVRPAHATAVAVHRNLLPAEFQDLAQRSRTITYYRNNSTGASEIVFVRIVDGFSERYWVDPRTVPPSPLMLGERQG